MTTTAFKDIVPTVFECGDRCHGEVGGEVDRRLEAVLARLVSDYRAIFVIEEEVIEDPKEAKEDVKRRKNKLESKDNLTLAM